MDDVFGIFPQLETEKLLLRSLRLTDAEALFDILSDTHVTRYYDDAPFTELSQAVQQIERWNGDFKAKRSIRWGITLKPNDVIIGSCGSYGFHWWHQRGSLGYELARPFWRQDVMTEALRAVIGFSFKEMGLNRLQATVMPKNLASIKLLAKLGFRQEGQLRAYENWAEKGFVDLLMFALLRDDDNGW